MIVYRLLFEICKHEDELLFDQSYKNMNRENEEEIVINGIKTTCNGVQHRKREITFSGVSKVTQLDV